MDKITFERKKWFLETPFPGIRRAKRDLFFIKEEILRKKTEFQEVFIFSTPGFGKILALDGIVQFSQADEFIYHEMMAHTSLLTHPLPKSILIIGGGDGGVLREITKYNCVERINLVEIDKEIPQLVNKYLKFVCKNAFKDKRLNIFYEDGAKFIQDRPKNYDVILVDSTDPVGPGKALFSKLFYQKVFSALKDNGLAIFQLGPFLDLNTTIRNSVNILRSLFKYVCLVRLPMPSYSCGCEYCFCIASKKYNPRNLGLKTLTSRMNSFLGKISLKYYSPEVHLASLVIPSLWQV